uniref:sphingomyelin phosphodiesterase 5-like n=1 Tax=Panthera onca TaxID=9690 RepID=UPI0029549790|nr:sphingomyelin phosphodiesterase 5-like [Panthera onca]
MQTLPDWPPASGAPRPSPFPHPGLHALHRLARALLFPAYWALDRLLGCCAPTARPSGLRRLKAAAEAGAALLLLLLVGLPLALLGLPLWLLLQTWRRPFCYQPPPQCWEPPAPWRPPAEPARCFSFLSANLCLLPDGLARFSNLKHSQRRAEAVGAALLAGLRPSRYGATGSSPPGPGAPCGVLTAEVPAGLEFVCLQEVFDLRSAHRLVSRLAPSLGPVLHDVGSCGLQPGPHLKLLGSGLLLASRYPLLRAAFRSFPHARREDALASKGLLSAQVPAQPPRRLLAGRGLAPPSARPPPGTILSTSTLRHSVACSPEMLRRALEQEEGRRRYLAGPLGGGRRAEPWRGRRLDYIMYRGAVGGPLSPEVEQVTFSTALAGLTDHLAVGLRLRVSVPS